MRDHPFFRTVWAAVNLLLVASLLLLVWGMVWEYSTRRYLKGFADAVVPLSASTEQKVEAILAWMAHGPARRTATDTESLALRDPQDTLNYAQLLQVCGSATNAFVNLASSSGLPARRLLLLDLNRNSKHVVAEVLLEGRWVVADPSHHILFRDAQGRTLTRAELQDPQMLRQATRAVPGYPPEYTFDRTAHIRLSRIPYLGALARGTLDTVLPGWEEAVNWTLVLERRSFAAMLAALLLVCFGLLARLGTSWYGSKRLGIARVRLREQLLRAGEVLFSSPREISEKQIQ